MASASSSGAEVRIQTDEPDLGVLHTMVELAKEYSQSPIVALWSGMHGVLDTDSARGRDRVGELVAPAAQLGRGKLA